MIIPPEVGYELRLAIESATTAFREFGTALQRSFEREGARLARLREEATADLLDAAEAGYQDWLAARAAGKDALSDARYTRTPPQSLP